MAPTDLQSQLDLRFQSPLRLWVADGAMFDTDATTYAKVVVTTLEVGIDPDESGLPRGTAYVDARLVSRTQTMWESNTGGQ